MDAAFFAQLSGSLASALLPFLTACGVGLLLLRLLDELRREATGRVRLRVMLAVLVVAVGLWALSLLPLAARWPLHAGASLLMPTLAAFCWSVAVAALWCVLGTRPGMGSVRALLMGLLLGLSSPATLLIQAGVSRLGETALQDAGLLGIVIVLSALASAAALQFALAPAVQAPAGAIRRPVMNLLVSVLLGTGLTLNAVFAAPLVGAAPDGVPADAPAWLRLVLAIGVVVTVFAAFLRGLRDRADGELSAAVASREIRRRKETMQALNDLEQSYRRRESELAARHQLLLDGAHVGLWEFDLVTRHAHFSERFAGMLGYALSEIGPSTSEYLRLVHPDDLPLVLNRIQAHVDNQASSYVAEFRMRNKDGSYRRILANGVALRDANGRATRMAGSHVEVGPVHVAPVLGAEDVRTETGGSPVNTLEAFAPKRQGLWESWSPLDHEPEGPRTETPQASVAQASVPSTVPPAGASDGTLPTIDPSSLH